MSSDSKNNHEHDPEHNQAELYHLTGRYPLMRLEACSVKHYSTLPERYTWHHGSVCHAPPALPVRSQPSTRSVALP